MGFVNRNDEKETFYAFIDRPIPYIEAIPFQMHGNPVIKQSCNIYAVM